MTTENEKALADAERADGLIRDANGSSDVLAHVWRLVAENTALRDRLARLEEELAIWKPLTPEEAEKALDEAEAVPLSSEQIEEIVRKATDPSERITNNEQAQLAARLRRLEAVADRVANDLVPVAGELMRRACMDKNEHSETCTCNTCLAFLATQKATTDLAAALEGRS